MTAAPSFSRQVRRQIEAGGMHLMLQLFRLLSVDRASALGGRVGRLLGPRLGVTRIAKRNLHACLPEMPAAERDKIISGMWENLGRTMAEYAHLDAFQVHAEGARIHITGGEVIDQVVADGKGAIFVGGHFANWELPPLALVERGLRVMEVYRAASNPLADEIITGLRHDYITPHQAAKGTRGARMMLKWLREKNYITMLVDQKMNDGISAPFFGRPAMSPPGAAHLARRLGCPVILVTIRRTIGAHFLVNVEAPLLAPHTADSDADVLAAVTEINARMERFIRAYPSQWLWLHRRWPD